MKQPKLKRNHRGRISKNAKKAFKKDHHFYNILNEFFKELDTPFTEEELKELNDLPESDNETP